MGKVVQVQLGEYRPVYFYDINQVVCGRNDYVILEGRESARAGMYRQNGELRKGLIADIIKEIDEHRLIFEAPVSSAQIYFIKHFGANVNLGNIKLQDTLLLECQRQALRSDTFNLL